MNGNSYRFSKVTTPAASLALVSLADAKAYLGITDSSQDAAISQQIDAVSLAIHNYCDHVLVHQTYQDQFRALYAWLDYGKPLRTRQYPIDPPITVTENGAVLDATAWEADLTTGALYRLSGSVVAAWSGTSILIAYDAGYDPIPDDLQAAALDWLSARRAAQGRDPALRREEIPDVINQMWEPDTLIASSIPRAVRDLLTPYRLWSV